MVMIVNGWHRCLWLNDTDEDTNTVVYRDDSLKMVY